MISTIGSTPSIQTAPVQTGDARVEIPAALEQAVASGAAATGQEVETQSALSSATARVGDELQAQSDAARVERAAGGTPPATAATATSDTGSADYIAEADTNSDKKVSDQERIAYEKKLERQAQEVRKAYAPEGETAPAVAVMA